jgi:hypothetical protein
MYIVIYQFKYIYVVILKYCKSCYVNYTIIIVINKISISIYSINIGIFDINTTLDYLVSLCTSSTLRQAIYLYYSIKKALPSSRPAPAKNSAERALEPTLLCSRNLGLTNRPHVP